MVCGCMNGAMGTPYTHFAFAISEPCYSISQYLTVWKGNHNSFANFHIREGARGEFRGLLTGKTARKQKMGGGCGWQGGLCWAWKR